MQTNSIENEQPDLETFKSLCEKFQIYIGELKTEWRRNNRPPEFKDVYEVLHPDQKKQIENHINLWDRYITPIAEEWWKECGYGVNWPDDNSKPVGYYKL